MIHLGYEWGTGQAVEIPLKHLAVTGQTQESGKTTTLEALISRSGLRAVAFVTKRGEGSFATGRRIPPYFRERTDWQFVESVLESTMRQKMRFERSWIIRATRGAHTLAEVRRNVKKLQEKSSRSMDQDMYMLLGEYLDLVVPLIEALPAAPSVQLAQGLNVMDLSPYPSQMQALVIRSVLEWVYDREQDTVTVIPEAWEFVPQARGSPVKLAAAQLVRKGAALRNFVWLDSQDLAGVDKEILKQVSVWLIGVQRETNELKRALAHIPAGIRKPKLEDVATLGRGQFFACWQGNTVKVYVQPAWMSAGDAETIARGKKTKVPDPPKPKEEPMSASLEAKIDKLIEAMGRQGGPPPATSQTFTPNTGPVDEEALYQRFKSRLAAEAPALLKVLAAKSELEIEVQRQVLQIDGSTLKGRLAQMIAAGFFDEVKTGNAAYLELQRKGFSTAKPNVYKELDKLTELGFLTKEAKEGYLVVAEARINIKK